jgi:hypothetical protein
MNPADLRQAMLELVYGLLDEDEERLLRERIEADPDAAALYAEAIADAKLIGEAARVDVPPIQFRPPVPADLGAELTLGVGGSVAPASEALATPDPLGAIAGAATSGSLSDSAPLMASAGSTGSSRRGFGLFARIAAGLMLAIGVGAVGFDAWVRGAIHDAGIRLRAEGPATLARATPTSFQVDAADPKGRPVERNFTFRIVDSNAGSLLYESSGRTAPSGARIDVPPLPQVPAAPRLEVELTADPLGESPRVADRPTLLQRSLRRVEPSTALALATDRTQVRPGETLRYRSLEIARGSGVPIANSAPTMSLKRGGRKIPLPLASLGDGVAAGSISFPPDLPGGRYELTAVSGRGRIRTVPIDVEAAPPASEWKTRIEPMARSVRPGETMIADVSVVDRSDAPLAGAEVTAIASANGVELHRESVRLGEDAKARFHLAVSPDATGDEVTVALEVAKDGRLERRTRGVPLSGAAPEIRLFPEGGRLPADEPARIYFAAMHAERPTAFEGTLVDDVGNTLATLKTGRDGLGDVIATIPSGRAIQVIEKGDDGLNREPRALRSFEAELGAITVGVDGPAMVAAGAELSAIVRGAGAKDPLSLAVLAGDHVVSLMDVPAGASPRRIAVPLPDALKGVARLMLVRREGGAVTPLAERLFLRAAADDLNVSIERTSSDFPPGSMVTGGVRVTDAEGKPVPALLGVSVADRAVRDDGRRRADFFSDIRLLSSFDSAEIENLDAYLADTDVGRRDLDRLLGTRGWRRIRSLGTGVDGSSDDPPVEDPLVGTVVAESAGALPEWFEADNASAVDAWVRAARVAWREESVRWILVLLGRAALLGLGIGVAWGLSRSLPLLARVPRPGRWIAIPTLAVALIAGLVWWNRSAAPKWAIDRSVSTTARVKAPPATAPKSAMATTEDEASRTLSMGPAMPAIGGGGGGRGGLGGTTSANDTLATDHRPLETLKGDGKNPVASGGPGAPGKEMDPKKPAEALVAPAKASGGTEEVTATPDRAGMTEPGSARRTTRSAKGQQGQFDESTQAPVGARPMGEGAESELKRKSVETLPGTPTSPANMPAATPAPNAGSGSIPDASPANSSRGPSPGSPVAGKEAVPAKRQTRSKVDKVTVAENSQPPAPASVDHDLGAKPGDRPGGPGGAAVTGGNVEGEGRGRGMPRQAKKFASSEGPLGQDSGDDKSNPPGMDLSARSSDPAVGATTSGKTEPAPAPAHAGQERPSKMPVPPPAGPPPAKDQPESIRKIEPKQVAEESSEAGTMGVPKAAAKGGLPRKEGGNLPGGMEAKNAPPGSDSPAPAPAPAAPDFPRGNHMRDDPKYFPKGEKPFRLDGALPDEKPVAEQAPKRPDGSPDRKKADGRGSNAREGQSGEKGISGGFGGGQPGGSAKRGPMTGRAEPASEPRAAGSDRDDAADARRDRSRRLDARSGDAGNRGGEGGRLGSTPPPTERGAGPAGGMAVGGLPEYGGPPQESGVALKDKRETGAGVVRFNEFSREFAYDLRRDPRAEQALATSIYWNPKLPTDADGRATWRFDLPAREATWDIRVDAHTLDGRVGSSRAPLTATLPLRLELAAPETLAVGDRAGVKVDLVNRGSEPTTVALAWRHQGTLVQPPANAALATRSVRVPGGGAVTEWIEVMATGVGEGSLRVSLTDRRLADEREVRLRTAAPPIGARRRFDAVIRDNAPLALGPNALAGAGPAALKLRIHPTRAARLADHWREAGAFDSLTEVGPDDASARDLLLRDRLVDPDLARAIRNARPDRDGVRGLDGLTRSHQLGRVRSEKDDFIEAPPGTVRLLSVLDGDRPLQTLPIPAEATAAIPASVTLPSNATGPISFRLNGPGSVGLTVSVESIAAESGRSDALSRPGAPPGNNGLALPRQPGARGGDVAGGAAKLASGGKVAAKPPLNEADSEFGARFVPDQPTLGQPITLEITLPASAAERRALLEVPLPAGVGTSAASLDDLRRRAGASVVGRTGNTLTVAWEKLPNAARTLSMSLDPVWPGRFQTGTLRFEHGEAAERRFHETPLPAVEIRLR